MFRTLRVLRTFNIFGKMEKVKLVDQIQLTPEEEKIFEILKQAQASQQKQVVMRVAGGWVRDKVSFGITQVAEQRVYGYRYCT